MGCFSWLYSDTNDAVKIGKKKDTYLLIPKQFQDKYGEYILEQNYDGNGEFGSYDVYDLVVEWNRNNIPEIIDRIKRNCSGEEMSEFDIKNLINFYKGNQINCEQRDLGIAIACMDKDNASLNYPIKITSKPMDYNEAYPSKSDPYQGIEYDEDELYENDCN